MAGYFWVLCNTLFAGTQVPSANNDEHDGKVGSPVQPMFGPSNKDAAPVVL
jgi:hypothetical protein